MRVTRVLEVEYQCGAIILTPQTNLGEFRWLELEFEREGLVNLLDNSGTKNVVIDFHALDYFGSTALALIVRLGELVNKRDGCMVLCNLSDHALEILEATNLTNRWLMVDSKEAALDALASPQLAF
jgi:anti-anti-sigma factor